MDTKYQPYALISATAKAFQLTADAIMKGRRTPYRTRARWAAAYLLKLGGVLSWGDIARFLAYNHHTSAMHAARAAARLIATDSDYRDLIRGLQVNFRLPVTNEQPPAREV